MEKLVQRILQPSFAYDVVLEYKNKLEEKSNEVIPQYVQLGWQ